MKKMNEINELQRYFSTFNEGYGTEYERYALNRFVSKMLDRYDISTVLEMPSNGVMGIPGIKSLIFAKLGCEVTVSHPSKDFLDNAKKIWDIFGLEANFVKSHWITSEFDDNSFDLVWNFCVFEHFDDPNKVVWEMLRVSKRYIFIEIQNVFNLGFPIHRFYHFLKKEPWDHGNLDQMKLSQIKIITDELNANTVEEGATDMPPWPDINIKLKEMTSKRGKKITPNQKNDEFAKLRPKVDIKEFDKLKSDIHSLKELPFKHKVVHHLFDLWFVIIENNSPKTLKKFFAHHPYIIAEKVCR